MSFRETYYTDASMEERCTNTKYMEGDVIIDETLYLDKIPREMIEKNPISQQNHTKSSSNVCVFCKKNGEAPSVYVSHLLKDKMGRVTCPQLRRHICPQCNATGDNAHTMSHCHNKPDNYLSIPKYPAARMANGKLKKSNKF